MDKVIKKISLDIKKHGWHVVTGRSAKDGAGFVFSIGLKENFDHPEALIFGLEDESMHHAINIIGEDVRKGKEYKTGIMYKGIVKGMICEFVKVDKKYYNEYLADAVMYYKSDEFPVLQCVWKNEDASGGITGNQPLLDK
jgi:hypothetical protein